MYPADHLFPCSYLIRNAGLQVRGHTPHIHPTSTQQPHKRRLHQPNRSPTPLLLKTLTFLIPHSSFLIPHSSFLIPRDSSHIAHYWYNEVWTRRSCRRSCRRAPSSTPTSTPSMPRWSSATARRCAASRSPSPTAAGGAA